MTRTPEVTDMTYLGLDLGSGFAKLARFDSAGLAASGGFDMSALPAAITYQGRYSARIPQDAAAEPRPGDVRCDGFPAVFGSPWSSRQVRVWGDRTASEVTRGYLWCLLDESGSAPTVPPGAAGPAAGSGTAPPELVAAVPVDAAALHGTDVTPSVSVELREALAMLGRPPQRLVAAPVAALLWLRHSNPGLAEASRVLVIDVGAGSADLTLCSVSKRAVRVTDAARYVGGAAWDGASLSGSWTVDGGRPAALAERLVMALAEAAGARPRPVGWETTQLWRAFEDALALPAVKERLDVVLQMAAAARRRHGAAPAIRFGGLEISADQFIGACEPLVRQCVSALGELLGRQDSRDWPRFGTEPGDRVVLLGGLAELRPVRAALLESLGLDPDRPGGSLLRPPAGTSHDAIARGAALLAAGVADPGDRYLHGLQLEVHRRVRGRLVPAYFELASPGSIDLEVTKTVHLAEQAGDRRGMPVLIRVPPSSPYTATSTRTAPIAVRIVPREGDPVPAMFEPAMQPPPGTYEIAVRGGPSGPTLLLLPADGGAPLAYALTQLSDTVPDGQTKEQRR